MSNNHFHFPANKQKQEQEQREEQRYHMLEQLLQQGEENSSTITHWSTEDVAQWLSSLLLASQESSTSGSSGSGGALQQKYQKYIEAFIQNEIDGSVLLSLTSEELKQELGIVELGIRKRIMNSISQLLSRVHSTHQNSQPGVRKRQRANNDEEEGMNLLSETTENNETFETPVKRSKTSHESETSDTSILTANTPVTAASTSVVSAVVTTPPIPTTEAAPVTASSSSHTGMPEPHQIEYQITPDSQQERDRLLALAFQPRSCLICMDMFDVDFLQPLSQCCDDHENSICRMCMKDYLISKIESREIPIKCPVPSCQKQASPEDLEIILDKKYVDLFEEFALHAVIESNPRAFSHCMTPDCDYMFMYNRETDSPDFQCPKCTKRYCMHCKVEYHVGSTCQEYEQWTIENGTADDEFLNYVQSKKAQRCGECQRWVERNQGCNHMTCLCGHEFCYVCGANYPCNGDHSEDYDDDEEDEE